MSTAESDEFADVLSRITFWPAPLRITLARRILESIETTSAPEPPRTKSPVDLIGMLKTDAPPPTDEQCRAIVETELIEKHSR